jgi:hypothetical protein
MSSAQASGRLADKAQANFRTEHANLNTGRPHSAAGAMWDTLSVRYARQAEGNVNVIHAASKDDPHFSGDRFKSSTWNQREKPTLESGAKTTIKEHFAEDLRGQLEGPAQDVPDYKGTGGFKGNLAE